MGRPTLSPHTRPAMRHSWRAVAAATVVVALSGCSDTVERGFMPGEPGITDESDRIVNLWVGSWVAALAVGVLTWGLIIWAAVAYRRRKDDVGLPAQVRYHVPLEIMYTIVPIMIVGVLFFYTARDQTELEALTTDPVASEDLLHINVVGKQWSWDFNYVDDDVYSAGVQANLDGTDAPLAAMPTLYLPVDQPVSIELTSRDVIHSFWVVEFLYKKDVVPGHPNVIEFTPQVEGTYAGRCAELCGEFHSEMLFQVQVVSQQEYDDQMQALRDQGQQGQLPNDLGRSDGVHSAIGGTARPGAIGEDQL